MIYHHTLEEIFKGPREKQKEAIKRFFSQGSLTWKNQKLIVDPFTSGEFVYEIEKKEDGFFQIEGKIKVGDKFLTLNTQDDILPICFIQNNFLRFFAEAVDKSWIDKVFPTPLLIDARALSEILDYIEVEGILLVWKNQPSKLKPDPLPILKLQDRSGAFGRLSMDYGLFGTVDIDPLKQEMTQEEKLWEKDLLETGFIKKTVGSSHYYCPLDKVVKTLSFLLDIGWTVFDYRGKKVYRQNALECEAQEKDDYILIKGKVSYGDYTGNLKDVFGMVTKRERFLDLTPEAVGLIDMPKEWEVFEGEEIVKEGICIKRQNYGLLEDFVTLPPHYTPSTWQTETLPEAFQGSLYAYQADGVSWLSFLARSQFHGLLADEMGLGKTVQIIAFIAIYDPLENPILIVMPKSLLFNWRQEFEKFLPSLDVYVHTGQERLNDCDILRKRKVILTSYNLLRQDRLLFEQLSYGAVILDEAQVIKNPDSLVSMIVCRLRARFRLAVTGTPVENRSEDLWALFRFLMPELLGEKKQSPIFEQVRKKIRPFILRRLKEDVAGQLPPKQEQIVWVEQDQEEKIFYEQFLVQKRSALVQKVTENGVQKSRFDILELILRLRQLCCSPKLISGESTIKSAKLDLLLSDMEEVVQSGRKALVYSQFTQMLQLIAKECESKGWTYAYLDGDTKDREKAVKAFQEDNETHLFLISLKAGGVGLNLTAADYVFLYEPWWNEAVENQAIDRAHRVGQKNTVIARRYITLESIEEKILRLKQKKSSLAKTLLDFTEELEAFNIEDLYKLALEF